MDYLRMDSAEREEEAGERSSRKMDESKGTNGTEVNYHTAVR